MNGDADLIVGAYLYDAGETDEGATFVFLGSATAMVTVPAQELRGDASGIPVVLFVMSGGST